MMGERNGPTVNPRFGRRTWVKLWVNEWLDGTTRFEMSDAQRAFWIDLLAMAGRSRFPGVVCAGKTPEGAFIGYPVNKFQSLMSEPIAVEETLALFARTGKIRIEVTATAPIRLLSIELLNWGKYQSEYQRQKPYRQRGLQQGDKQSYNQGYNQGYTTEVEVEVRSRSKKKKEERVAHPAFAPARDFAFKAFEEKFQQKPNWTTRDFVQLAGLFSRRPELTLEEFKRRWDFHLLSTDPFIAKRGWGLGYFSANFDSFMAGPVNARGAEVKKSAAQEAKENERRRNEISPEGRKILERFN